MRINWNTESEGLHASAEWRRAKAEEYPQDAKRNLEAARRLDEIADHLADSSFYFLHRKIEQCVGDDAEMLVEEIDALNSMILPPASAPEYLAKLVHAIRRRAA